MKPITPVIPGANLPEVVFAKDQPEYLPLPAYRDSEGTVITRWRLSFRERLQVAWSGDIWLTMLTFNRPLQPVKLETRLPALEASPHA